MPDNLVDCGVWQPRVNRHNRQSVRRRTSRSNYCRAAHRVGVGCAPQQSLARWSQQGVRTRTQPRSSVLSVRTALTMKPWLYRRRARQVPCNAMRNLSTWIPRLP